LRVGLKRLREGTRGQFSCFRRVKRSTVGVGPDEERGRR
jgi:exocyst complex component 2